jgi:hypothetical protein
VPLCACLLLLAQSIQFWLLVDLFELLARDGRDLRITSSEFTFRVQDWVDVKSRGLGLAGKLSKSVNQCLLDVVGQIVLCSEEHDATFRDCSTVSFLPHGIRDFYLLLIAKSLVKSSAFGELIHSTRFAVGYSVPITGVTSTDSNPSRVPDDFNGSLWPCLEEMIGISVSTAEGAMLKNGFSQKSNCTANPSTHFSKWTYIYALRLNGTNTL